MKILIYFFMMNVMVMGGTEAAPREAISISSVEHDVELSPHLLIREDVSRSAGITDIQAIPAADFANIPNTKRVIGFSRSAFWARFDLENPGTNPQSLLLEYGYPTVDYLDFYGMGPAGQLEKKSSGDKLPARVRDVHYRLPVFAIEVPPGKHTYFLRLETEGAVQFPLKLWKPERFHDKRNGETGFLGILYGFIVVMALYNTFLAVMLRSPVNWIYVLFILSSISNFMGYQGLWVLFAPEGISAWMSNQGFIMSSGFFATFASIFTYLFLDMKRRSRILQTVTLTGGVIGIGVILISLFSYNVAAKISNLNSMIACLGLLVASLFACFQRFRPAYFYSVAWLVTIVGNIVTPMAVMGLVSINTFTVWGAFIGVAVETVLISLALGDKIKLSQDQAAKVIQDLNEGLEAKVEEKTRDIKAIMSHIKLGIFAVETPQHLIHKDYSRHLETLFGQPDLVHRQALPLILENAQIAEDEKQQIQSVMEASIGEDVVAFDANEATLPREIQYLREQKRQIFEFGWSPILNREGRVERILVTCKDVTELRQIQSEVQHRQKELEYIGELINVSQDTFSKFLASAMEILRENRRLLLVNADVKAEAAKILFINLHTLKGASRSLGFKSLTSKVHEAEETLSHMQKKLQSWSREALLLDHDAIQASLDEYEGINSRRLNRSSTSSHRVEIPIEDLERQLANLEGLQIQPEQPVMEQKFLEVKRCLSRWTYRPAQDVIREFFEPSSRLARDLGKEQPEIIIRAQDIYFTYGAVELLRNAFIHIIRNALDHGIETAEERLASGKRAQGVLTVATEVDHQGHLFLRVCDDGRGLALKMIAQIAIIKGFMESAHDKPLHEIAHFIFQSGFSTSMGVTDISGRGVGMDAVRRWLENGHAAVSIELDKNLAGDSMPDFIPFTLAIRLPPHLFRSISSHVPLAKAS